MASSLFHEAPLPGKGLGVVASKPLQPGQLLLAEPPLLIVPWWNRLTEYNKNKERTQLLGKQLRELSKEQQQQFWELADCKAGVGEDSSIDGIWRTNNFALGHSGPKSDNGLFLNISRFNHSCHPFAEFTWNSSKKRQELRIVRPTPQGAEITISYFTLVTASQPRAGRKEYLQAHYGFPCDCPSCSLEGPEGEEDDQERGEVDKLAARIEDLLYEEEEEEEGHHKVEEDLKSIQLAVDLSWQRLGLMERRGFKVVSMLRQCWDLVAVAKEWNLQDTLDQVVARGAHLAQVLYGGESEQVSRWGSILPSPG